MLSLFRQRGASHILYGAIIVGTLLTFVIEFRPNASQRTASFSEACVARVRGRCIDPKDFGAAYRILAPSRSAEVSRRMSLKRVALDGLIERELLDDEAKRVGLSVSDDELTDQLYKGFIRVSLPAADPTITQQILGEMYQSYARAGVMSQETAQAHYSDRDTAIPVDFRGPKTKAFDMKVYERLVRNLTNRSTAEFREEQARELLAAKMRDVVRDPVRVSADEAWREYDRRYTTATVAWIPVKESWASRWAVDPQPLDVAAWQKEHQEAFGRTLDERKKEDAPKAGHVRHILVKFPYGASDDEKSAALAKLSWAAARIKAGEPFAEVARTTSDDEGSAAQGGDVGDKTDGFVAPFKAAADMLRPGETTAGAVETQFGYHLIGRDDPTKSADINAQLERTLGRQMVVKERAPEASQRVARGLDESLRAGKHTEDALRDLIAAYVHAERVETLKVVTPVALVAVDGGSPRDGEAAPQTATKKAPSTQPASVGFDAASDPDRPQVQTSSAFNGGGDPFPGLSPEGTAKVVSFAFAAKAGDVMPEAVRTADSFVVVQQKEHKVATREEFEKNGDAFEREMVSAKRDEALALYVKHLRALAKEDIKIDTGYVQEVSAEGGAGGPGEEEDQY